MSAGAGTLVEALAGGLGAEDLHKALDFLLGQGLADADGDIRDQMVAAGGCVCMLLGGWRGSSS